MTRLIHFPDPADMDSCRYISKLNALENANFRLHSNNYKGGFELNLK